MKNVSSWQEPNGFDRWSWFFRDIETNGKLVPSIKGFIDAKIKFLLSISLPVQCSLLVLNFVGLQFRVFRDCKKIAKIEIRENKSSRNLIPIWKFKWHWCVMATIFIDKLKLPSGFIITGKLHFVSSKNKTSRNTVSPAKSRI